MKVIILPDGSHSYKGGKNDWGFCTITSTTPREAKDAFGALCEKYSAEIDEACDLQGYKIKDDWKSGIKETHQKGFRLADKLRTRLCREAGVIDS